MTREFRYVAANAPDIACRPTPVDAQVLSLGPTQRLQAFPKGRRARLTFWIILRIVHQHSDAAHPIGLLRSGGKRPCRSGGGERKEFAAIHSITSLARAMNTSDNETPRDAAVLRLTAM